MENGRGGQSTSNQVMDLTGGEDDQPDSETDQVMFFQSDSELAEYAMTKFNLKRIMLADLQGQSDLERGYVGGRVMGQVDFSDSQSNFTEIFIQDKTTEDRHLLVQVDMQIIVANDIPALDNGHRLFLHKAELMDDNVEFSQDFGKRIVVSGVEPRVWVVHKHANTEKFFQATCGKKYWKKRKKYLAQKKSEKEQKRVSDITANRPGPSGVTSLSFTEPAPPTIQDQTFPDVADFPDSAFADPNMDIDQPPSSLSSTEYSSSSSDSDSMELTGSDMEWTPKRRKTGKTGCNYEYTKLADLTPSGDNEKINVIAVVKEFTLPSPSRGSDYSCTLTLVDETNPNVGVRCVLFHYNPKLLPCVRKVGDILSLHRIFANDFQFSLQLSGRYFSSFLRFSGDVHKKIRAKTGNLTYTFLHKDKQRVQELRWWALKKKRNEHACKLDSITPDLHFNLLCQIISVAEVEDAPQWYTVLTVWDGTPLHLKARRINERGEVNDGGTGFVATAHGYEEQIFVYDRKCLRRKALRPGKCVFLHGVHAVTSQEPDDYQIELRMSRERPPLNYMQLPCEIEVLTSRDYAFKDLQRQLEETATSQNLVTTSLHTRRPFFTLEEIRDWSMEGEGASMKFRSRVKLAGMITPSLEDMVKLRCSQCDLFEPITREMDIDDSGTSNEFCQLCSSYRQTHSDSPKPFCMYHFVVMVSDYTGVVNAHVSHEEAIRLLNGIQPTNFYRHQRRRHQVNALLYSLTGGNNPFNTHVTTQPRPWLDCCIVKVKRSGGELLCLFDTVLKSDT